MPGMVKLDVSTARHYNADLIELKVDGTRITYDGNKLLSDRMVNRNNRYSHILRAMDGLPWRVRGEIALPGGNILQLNRRENWEHAHFYVFDLYEYKGKDTRGLTIIDKRAMLDEIVKELNHPRIHVPKMFQTFDEGWDYVLDTDAEGLVLKTNHENWKVKYLKEEKLPVIEHVAGKSKGSFIIDRNGVRGKVSGTSMEFVEMFNYLKSEGLTPYAEIEYAFLTDDGVPYQPRLRRMGTKEMLATT